MPRLTTNMRHTDWDVIQEALVHYKNALERRIEATDDEDTYAVQAYRNLAKTERKVDERVEATIGEKE